MQLRSARRLGACCARCADVHACRMAPFIYLAYEHGFGRASVKWRCVDRTLDSVDLLLHVGFQPRDMRLLESQWHFPEMISHTAFSYPALEACFRYDLLLGCLTDAWVSGIPSCLRTKSCYRHCCTRPAWQIMESLRNRRRSTNNIVRQSLLQSLK